MSTRSSYKGILAAAALVAAGAIPAHAQQRELFRWSGRVDQEIQLTMTGRQLSASNVGPREPGQRRANVMSPLPRTDGQLNVQLVNGRGSVDVIQQPSAQNGYTAVVRIRDPQSGTGSYTLNAYWQPAAAGELGRPFGRGFGRARTALQWSGNVDDNLLIVLRPGGVSYRTVSGDAPRGVQASFSGLPSTATSVNVSLTQGRGNVFVAQQPSAANGYTALIRVQDPQSGYGRYAFDVTWR